MKKTMGAALFSAVFISILFYSLSAAAIYWSGTNNGSAPISVTGAQGTAEVKNDGAGGKKPADSYNRITGENLAQPQPSAGGAHISENYMGTPAKACYSYTIETDFILFDDKTVLGQTFNLYDDLPDAEKRTSNWYDLYRIGADGIKVTNRFSDADKTVFGSVSTGRWHSFAASFTWEAVDAANNQYALTGMNFWLDGKGPVTKTLTKKTYGVYRFAFGAFSKTADYGIDNIRHCVDKEYNAPEALPQITSKVYAVSDNSIKIDSTVSCKKFLRVLSPPNGCEIVLFADDTLAASVTDGTVQSGSIAAVRGSGKINYYEVIAPRPYTLVDTNDAAAIAKSGAEISDEFTLSGKHSIKWSNHTKNTSIRFGGLKADGNQYNAVEFSIYSPNATDETFAFIIDCAPQTEGSPSYFKADITVDWTGWKKFRLIAGANLSCVRSAKLSELSGCRFTLDGWNMQPVDGTELYIDSVILSKYEPSPADHYFSADETEKADSLLRSVYCTYASSASVIAKGMIKAIGSSRNAAPYIAAGGDYMLPKEFLNSILGLDFEGADYINSERLSDYGYYTIASGNILFISESLSSAQAAAQSALVSDITEYYIKYSCETYTQDDFREFKERLRASLIGAEADDRESAYAKRYKKAVDAAAAACLDKMNTSPGSAPWGDINSGTALGNAFDNIYTLSRAYAMPQGGYYGDAELCGRIISALDYVTDNFYTGDDNSLYTNDWYTAKILCAGSFVNTLLLMEEHIPNDKMRIYLNKLSFYNNINSVLADSVINTASNLTSMVYTVMAAAALREDAEVLLACRDILMREYKTVESGEGFYADGSYIMHGSHAYNNGYGIVEFTAMQDFDSWFRESAFCSGEFSKCFWKDTLIKAYYDQCYDGEFINIFNSRMIDGGVNPTWHMYPFLNAYNLSDGSEKAMWAGIVKGFLQRNTAANYLNYVTAYPYSCYIALREIAADGTVIPTAAREVNRAYNSAAKVTHLRADYGFGISMFSPKIADYECINGENTEGWYHNMGRTVLYDSSHFQYGKDYWKYINPLRIPGTTVDARPKEKLTIDRGNESFNEKSFVGGVTLNGKYGTAAMSYRGIHLGADGKNDSTLNVSKAWFMFDDEIVALGSGISSSDGYDVLTVVENKMLQGDEAAAVNGQTLAAAAAETEYPDTDTVWIEGTGGYYFPNGEKITAGITGGERKFFEMYINHGKNPQNEGYAYVILPGMTARQTDQYAAEPAVEILYGENDIRAVRHKKLGITGIVFGSAGTMCGITVSHPCIVMLENAHGRVTLSVTEPTGAIGEMKICAEGIFEGVEASDKNISWVIKPDRAEITLKSENGIDSVQLDLLAKAEVCGFTYRLYENEGYAAITGINTEVLNTEELLHTLDIPRSIAGYPVKAIAELAFAGNGSGFTLNGKKPIYRINIPDGVEKIGAGAFLGCENLSAISMPNSVTEIGERLFMGCTGLKSVSLSAGLTNLPRQTFFDCLSLSEIYLPGSVSAAESDIFNTTDSNGEICCTIYSPYERQWKFDNRNAKISYRRAQIRDNKNGTVSVAVFADSAVIIKTEYDAAGGVKSVLTAEAEETADRWYRECVIPVSGSCGITVWDSLRNVRPLTEKYSKQYIDGLE